MQSFVLIETYAYVINTDLVCKKEEIKCNKMFNFDYITKEDLKEHNPNQPETLTIHIEY